MRHRDRRSLLGVGLALPLLVGTRTVLADDACVVFDKAAQAAITPDKALQRLMDGNARLLAGKVLPERSGYYLGVAELHAITTDFARALAANELALLIVPAYAHRPFAEACAAHLRPGQVVVLMPGTLGSLEFATKLTGARLVMVLGHSGCGAIKGAIDNVQLGNLTATLANIRPAVEATTGVPGEHSSKNHALVQAVAETNARLAARMLLERSPVMSGLVDAGSLKVVAAMHDIGTGRVTLLG